MHGWGLEQLDNRTQLFSQTIKSDRGERIFLAMCKQCLLDRLRLQVFK